MKVTKPKPLGSTQKKRVIIIDLTIVSVYNDDAVVNLAKLSEVV